MTFDLTLDEVRKQFRRPGGADSVMALDGISLDVRPGTVVGIIGSNGAGKSTLLAAIAGTLLPDGGTIIVGDRDVTSVPSWKRTSVVARVQQNPQANVFGDLTIEENFALKLAGTSRFGLRRAKSRKVRLTAAELLARFGMGLEDRLDTPAGVLSGGQRQAVAVAMSLAGDPTVLLLDEHTAALDPRSARLVGEETARYIRQAGTTTLMVTHDMRSALADVDRLIMMHRGAIVMDISGAEKSEYTVPKLVERFEELTGDAVSDRVLLG